MLRPVTCCLLPTARADLGRTRVFESLLDFHILAFCCCPGVALGKARSSVKCVFLGVSLFLSKWFSGGRHIGFLRYGPLEAGPWEAPEHGRAAPGQGVLWSLVTQSMKLFSHCPCFFLAKRLMEAVNTALGNTLSVLLK